MKTLFNSLSALATPIGYIIHVGAGQCSELQRYQDLDPQRIILIEADAQQVTQLKSITQAQNNIKVITCAVADIKEAQTLKILSNPRDSSLLMPEKILDYYPSLALAREQTVTTETLNDLLHDYTLEEGYHHLLVIEVPGLESQIIQSTPTKCLQQFSGIIIRSSSEQLYQQEQQENIAELLEPAGFENSYYENEQFSTVFNKHYFQRNNEKIALMHCNDQINELTTINADGARQATEREQKISGLIEQQNVQSEISAEKQNQIERLNSVNAEQTELVTKRQQQMKKLKLELSEQTKLVADKKNKINQANKFKDEQVKLVAEVQEQIKTLTQERDTQVKTVSEKQKQVDQLNTAKAEQIKLATERQQTIEKLTQELSVQAKLVENKQSQIDLGNKTKDEQSELIAEGLEQNKKLTQERDAQAQTAIERQSQIDLSKKATEEQSKLAAQRQQQIRKLTEEFDTQVKQGQEQQTQLTTLTKNIEQLKKSIAGLETELNSFKETEDKRLQELEEAQQTASLSVKLQMLKEGDLQDLQKRYQQALVTQENQHELLNKLSERLSLAAGYFHQISQEQQIEEDKRIAQSKNKPRKGLARLFNFKRSKSS